VCCANLQKETTLASKGRSLSPCLHDGSWFWKAQRRRPVILPVAGASAQPHPPLCFKGNSLITSFLPPEEGPQMLNAPPKDQQEQIWARYHPSSIFTSKGLANSLLGIKLHSRVFPLQWIHLEYRSPEPQGEKKRKLISL